MSGKNRNQDPRRIIAELRARDDEEGTEESALRLAVAELDTGVEAEDGLKILNYLASAGNTAAMRKFAELFSEGRYYAKDEGKAIECLRRADQRGDAEAAFLLGRRFRLGIGTEPDEKRAVRFFARAADRGHMKAKYQLAVYCLGEKRPEEGFALLRQCFQGGLAEAGYDYAVCMLNGEGVRRNVGKAVSILENLAAQGDKDAALKLEFMYRTGYRIKKDPAKASVYAKLAGKGS